jgi:hypothetical protein
MLRLLGSLLPTLRSALLAVSFTTCDGRQSETSSELELTSQLR